MFNVKVKSIESQHFYYDAKSIYPMRTSHFTNVKCRKSASAHEKPENVDWFLSCLLAIIYTVHVTWKHYDEPSLQITHKKKLIGVRLERHSLEKEKEKKSQHDNELILKSTNTFANRYKKFIKCKTVDVSCFFRSYLCSVRWIRKHVFLTGKQYAPVFSSKLCLWSLSFNFVN